MDSREKEQLQPQPTPFSTAPGYSAEPPPQYQAGPAPQYPPGSAPQYPAGSALQYPAGSAPQYPAGSAPQYPAGSAPQYPAGSAPQYPAGYAVPPVSTYPASTGNTVQSYPTAQHLPNQVQTTYVQQPVVTGQPLLVGQPMVNAGVPPPDHAALAWLSCLLCFWPTGIVAIINAHSVDEKFRAGDMHGAMTASRRARLFGIISVCVGGGSYILATIMVIIYIGAVAASSQI